MCKIFSYGSQLKFWAVRLLLCLFGLCCSIPRLAVGRKMQFVDGLFTGDKHALCCCVCFVFL